jgi:hypothetical protein
MWRGIKVAGKQGGGPANWRVSNVAGQQFVKPASWRTQLGGDKWRPPSLAGGSTSWRAKQAVGAGKLAWPARWRDQKASSGTTLVGAGSWWVEEDIVGMNLAGTGSWRGQEADVANKMGCQQRGGQQRGPSTLRGQQTFGKAGRGASKLAG